MLRIGVSSCFFHADPLRPVFKGKVLLYLVEDVGHWLAAGGALPFMIPTLPANSPVSLRDMVSELDGLVLQGGADVAPDSYGEKPLKAEWAGDAIRDQYEIALVNEFRGQRKPILGLCRGLQLLNVAFRGTLYQDIGTQMSTPLEHRKWEIYEDNAHEIEIAAGTKLAAIYDGARTVKVNSVHHQAIKDLGRGLRAEAFAIPDRIVEAIRYEGPEYIVGVQWHPEFQKPNDKSFLNTKPLLDEFLSEAKNRKGS